ncbi:hypothetical protein ACC733_37600, partial [Rhizobium johnstonii]
DAIGLAFLGAKAEAFCDRRARARNRRGLAVQQVVAIARAVDLSGKVLILDEPTASLDNQEVALLFRIIDDLKKRGLGIVFITHFLEQVYA